MEQTDRHSLLLIFFLFALSALAFTTVVLQARKLESLASATTPRSAATDSR
jgi:hypothetical protein